MNPTLKAGAVIIRKGLSEPEMLLVYRVKLDDWSFPKGHCEAGETNEQTMIREVQEETGLAVEIVKTLPNLEYKNAKGDMSVAMYLAIPADQHQEARPEHPGDKIEWVPISQIEERLTYQNLKDYFKEIRQFI